MWAKIRAPAKTFWRMDPTSTFFTIEVAGAPLRSNARINLILPKDLLQGFLSSWSTGHPFMQRFLLKTSRYVLPDSRAIVTAAVVCEDL